MSVEIPLPSVPELLADPARLLTYTPVAHTQSTVLDALLQEYQQLHFDTTLNQAVALLEKGDPRQLERLRMAHPAPRTALALLWVITQKEYFGTPGTHFVRDVALLDTAHFAHDRNLPRSATTARLLVLSQAAHLSAEVAALQREQTETLDRERQGAQRSADMAEAGTGVAFAFGIPAVFLWRRKRRLQRKLEGSAEMGPEIQAVSGS